MRPSLTGLDLFAITVSGGLYADAYRRSGTDPIQIWGGKVGGLFSIKESPVRFARELLRYRLDALISSDSGAVLQHGIEDFLGYWLSSGGAVDVSHIPLAMLSLGGHKPVLPGRI